METYITTAYVIADEVVRILKIQDDPQSIMSSAEVITFAIVTAKFFSGNFKMARYSCQKMNLFPNLLSNSRLNRRIHKISGSCWEAIFRLLALPAKMMQMPAILQWIVFLSRIVRKTESTRESTFKSTVSLDLRHQRKDHQQQTPDYRNSI